MIALTFNSVDKFVNKQIKTGNDVRWDNWTLVFFNKDGRARNDVNGRFRAGSWGFETRVSPNRKGLWMVKPTLVRNGKSFARR